MPFSILYILLVYISSEIQAEFHNDDPCRTFNFVGPREIKRMQTGCDHIYGNIWVLSNGTEYEEMIRVFSQVKVVQGCISIHNTNYEDFSFFGLLEKVDCQDGEIQAIPMVETFGIKNNAKLKKLGMPNLVSINGPETAFVSIDGSNQLCFDEHDTEYFLMEPPNSFPTCKSFVLCSTRPDPSITNGSQIPESCSTISWDIVLEGEIPDKFLRRLRQLETLEGTFTLRNSTVTILDLSKLRTVQTKKKGPAVTITNNPRLVEIKLTHGIEIKTQDNSVPFLITSNPAFTISDTLCDFYEQSKTSFIYNKETTCRSMAPVLT